MQTVNQSLTIMNINVTKQPVLPYRVGPHTFHLVNCSAIDIAEAIPSLTPFAITTQDTEPLFELHLTDSAGPILTEDMPTDISFDWEDARCTIRPLTKEAHLITITPKSEEQSYCMECTDSFRHCTAYLTAYGQQVTNNTSVQSSTTGFILNNFLMMLYAFNAARHHTLLMHASVIAHEGKGYLFLGKSGTGKSTHTGLWLKHIPGCHLLNDDNPVVHIDNTDKQATVYGSPWSGKTPCYRNESMPVGAFVRLEQAPQNEIEREIKIRAFAALLPSCSCLKQDKDIYSGIVSTVTSLALLAPVFHLKCLPDQEAVEICKKTVVR